MSIEVKIGIADTAREVSIQSAQEADEVLAAVEEALSGKKDVLSLSDDRGARYLVPATKIAYVEVGAPESRRVGFGS